MAFGLDTIKRFRLARLSAAQRAHAGVATVNGGQIYGPDGSPIAGGGGTVAKAHSTTITTDGAWDQGTVTLGSAAAYVTSDSGSILGGSTVWAVIGPACLFDGVTPSSWLASPGINLCVVTRIGTTVATFVNGSLVNARAVVAPATSFSVGGGGGGGQVNVQSSPFTISVPGVLASPLTVNISATGGALSSSSVVIPAGTNQSGTFTFTPNSTPQTCVITFTNSGGLTNQAPLNWVSTAGATVPGAPTGLALGATTSTSQAFTWAAPGSNGGSALTTYRVGYRTPAGAGAYTYVATGSTATSYTLNGLTASTNYDFVVDAVNVIGAGPDSTLLNQSTSAGVSDVLTFGSIANGSFGTSGGYQTVTGAGSGSWTTRAQAYASNKRLQGAPSSDVFFSMTVAAPATECALVGVNLDNLQSTVFTSGVFGCYGGGASYSPAGAGLVNTVPCAAGDTVRVRRSILNGTQDRLYAEVASAAAPSTWTIVCQLTVSNTTPYYPMISAATAFAAAVVKCNGAAA